MGSADFEECPERGVAVGKAVSCFRSLRGTKLCRSALGAKNDSTLLAVLLRTFEFELADPAYELKLGKLYSTWVTCVSNT
jgi:hypothetical protein